MGGSRSATSLPLRRFGTVLPRTRRMGVDCRECTMGSAPSLRQGLQGREPRKRGTPTRAGMRRVLCRLEIVDTVPTSREKPALRLLRVAEQIGEQVEDLILRECVQHARRHV
jgi:hypothetical protein